MRGVAQNAMMNPSMIGDEPAVESRRAKAKICGRLATLIETYLAQSKQIEVINQKGAD